MASHANSCPRSSITRTELDLPGLYCDNYAPLPARDTGKSFRPRAMKINDLMKNLSRGIQQHPDTRSTHESTQGSTGTRGHLTPSFIPLNIVN